MREKERGSALILATLVVVVLTLLGLSFLLVADIENRIAENERLSAQALYFAEAGTRAVLQWFDRPGSSLNLLNPPLAAIDRDLRVLDDGDPATTPPPLQDGSATLPRYKQGVDRDADGQDDLFDRPYRIDPKDTFLGIEGNPDIRIDGEHPGPAFDFLDALSRELMGGYLAADTGIRARLSEIEIYAPPYLRIGTQWIRYGIATVKVTGRIYRVGFGADQVLAERMVKAVLSEIPYSTSYGPLHSCKDVTLSGALPIHWGTVTAVDNVSLGTHTDIPASLARAPLQSARNDLLWGDSTTFPIYRDTINLATVEDPWLRVIAGESYTTPDPGGTASQPWPFVVGQPPNHDGPGDGAHSNLFQHAIVACPEFDYGFWKAVAMSGRQRVEYYAYVPSSGDRFSRDGVGVDLSFQEITDSDPTDPARHPAILFFDTADSQPPHDDDGDGNPDNVTTIETTGTWAPRGLIYLNAASFRTTATGRPTTISAPGEPFLDASRWINLQYPTVLTGAFRADDSNAFGGPGTAVRNDRGPDIPNVQISMNGIFYTSGKLDLGAAPGVRHYGSFIAAGGVIQSNSTPANIYWDESIGLGNWPPPAWDLPRVTVTRWETDM